MVSTKVLLTGIAAVICLTALSCFDNLAGTSPTGKTDDQCVAADKSALAITYITGDNSGSVTGNVGLPASGANGSSISWVTSNSARITDEGVVTRPALENGDAVVTLTATIAKGPASDMMVFNVTVKAKSSNTSTETVTDADGNVYTTLKIGNQVWTLENWRSTKYNDGTAIPHVSDSAAWLTLTTPGFCYYTNATHADTIKKWGALYNWYTVNTGKLAPEGWRVPTHEDWDILQDYLIANGYNWDGTTDGNKIAKSVAAQTDWTSYPTTGTVGNEPSKNNASGFSGLTGGYRNFGGNFLSRTYRGYWWSTTDDDAIIAWNRNLYYDYEKLNRGLNHKRCGFSVRLLRD